MTKRKNQIRSSSTVTFLETVTKSLPRSDGFDHTRDRIWMDLMKWSSAHEKGMRINLVIGSFDKILQKRQNYQVKIQAIAIFIDLSKVLQMLDKTKALV